MYVCDKKYISVKRQEERGKDKYRDRRKGKRDQRERLVIEQKYLRRWPTMERVAMSSTTMRCTANGGDEETLPSDAREGGGSAFTVAWGASAGLDPV